MRSNTISIALVALLMLGLSGCGEQTLATPATEETDPTVDAASEEPADPDLPSNEDLEKYVKAIASEKVATLQEAKPLVEEGSAAAGYLEYLTHSVNAQIDGGVYVSDVAGKAKPIDGGFEVCYLGEEDCNEYTNFVGEEGKIVDFDVSDKPVSQRLVMGDNQIDETFGGATVELVAAYMNAANSHLIISYNLQTGNEELDMPLSTYRSADGRQSQSEMDYGMYTLAPDSKSSYVAYFPGASLDGEVHLDFYSSVNFQEDTIIFEIAEN